MAWGSDTAATQLTSITTEQFFNQVPTLNPRETAHVQVSVDFPSSPTDHLLVAVTENTTGLRPAWEAITWNAGTGSRIETLFLGEDVASVTFVPNTSLIVVTRSNRERQLVDVAAPRDRAAMKVPVTEDLIRRISAATRE